MGFLGLEHQFSESFLFFVGGERVLGFELFLEMEEVFVGGGLGFCGEVRLHQQIIIIISL